MGHLVSVDQKEVLEGINERQKWCAVVFVSSQGFSYRISLYTVSAALYNLKAREVSTFPKIRARIAEFRAEF